MKSFDFNKLSIAIKDGDESALLPKEKEKLVRLKFLDQKFSQTSQIDVIRKDYESAFPKSKHLFSDEFEESKILFRNYVTKGLAMRKLISDLENVINEIKEARDMPSKEKIPLLLQATQNLANVVKNMPEENNQDVVQFFIKNAEPIKIVYDATLLGVMPISEDDLKSEIKNLIGEEKYHKILAEGVI